MKDYFVKGSFGDEIRVTASGWPDCFDVSNDIPQPYIILEPIIDGKQNHGVWLSEKQALKLIKTIEKALVKAGKEAMKVKLERLRNE